MHGFTFLRDLALVLGTAAVTTVLFRALKLPVALGYVLAGLLLGPHLPTGIDADPATVNTLSELGVTLLMFSVGLELSFSKLLRVGSSAVVTAFVEVSLVFWLGYVGARAFDISSRESVFVGATLAISSTMLVAKTLDAANDRSLRQLVLGILVVEDLLAIVALTALTPLASSGGLSPAQLGFALLKLVLFLAAVLIVGAIFVPRAARAVVKLGSPETTLVASVGFCFSAALLASMAGFSVALGAFIAGALIAESGESDAVEHVVAPVRDLFTAIFLVAVGMQVDPKVAAQHPGLVGLLVVLVLFGKVVGVTLGGIFTGTSISLSLKSGVALAQIGELSFVIAGLASGLGEFGTTLYPSIVATSMVTAICASLAIGQTARWSLAIENRLPDALKTWLTFYASWIDDLSKSRTSEVRGIRRIARLLLVDTTVLCVLILSQGLGKGRALPWLTAHGVPSDVAIYVYVLTGLVLGAPFMLGVLRAAQRLGRELTNRVLTAPSAQQLDLAASARSVFLVTLQLLVVSLVGLPIMAIAQLFLPPGSPVVLFLLINLVLGVSFMRSAMSFQGHVRAGAQVVLEALTKQARRPDSIARMQAVLPGFSNLTTVSIDARSVAVGHDLCSLNLRHVTGATVLAIRRHGDGMAAKPDEILLAGDELVLTGTDDAVAAARDIIAPR